VTAVVAAHEDEIELRVSRAVRSCARERGTAARLRMQEVAQHDESRSRAQRGARPVAHPQHARR
jgi:hypothetical protein